jgi:hypothetical protein
MIEQSTVCISGDEYRIIETADLPAGEAYVDHNDSVIWIGAGLSHRLSLILVARAVSRAWSERLEARA